MNQEVLWRNRARQWTPPSTAGQYQRFAAEAASMVRGTGSAGAVAGFLTHRPLFNAALGAIQQRGANRRQLAQQTQQAINQQQVVQQATGQPQQPQQPAGAQAPRSAPPTVSPTAVATRQAAQSKISILAGQAVASPKAGQSTGPASLITDEWRDRLNQSFTPITNP
jgi:hypothetical protein